MKLAISLVFVTFLSINAHSAIQLDSRNLNPQTAQKLQSFITEVETKLPSSMKEKLNSQTITVQFGQLDNENKIVIPNCSNNVDSLSEAAGVKSQYAKAVGKNKGARYNFQTQSTTNKNVIVLNNNFINVIVGGESSAQKYNCDHQNTYRLAQGALINGLARIYDDATSTTVKGSNQKTAKVSDRLQYKYISGWTEKKLQPAFWPRAINAYEYAGDTADHFALNVEFFLLDSEYACRRPLLQDYLVKTFGADPLSSQRNCEVNTELVLPYERVKKVTDISTQMTTEELVTDLKTYDINPDKVYNIYYMKASAGGGFGFGHSMFRVVVCPPNMSISKDCEKVVTKDIVFNPRANPNEMRLDNLRGFFGGYPSQFLVSPVSELVQEYGNNELRHLFNMPLGYRDQQGQFVEQMPEDQKRRFIWAALESYWAYYGNYKFVSNNCADEAMRLYQMSSTDPKVLQTGVLKPNDINKKLHKLGYVDETDVKKFEKTTGIIGRIFGRGKIKSQKEYDERRALIEQARYENAFVSRVFAIEDAVRGIMALEGNPNPDFKTAKKEIKKWMNLATPDFAWDEEDTPDNLSDISKEQKEEILQATFYQIKARFDNLMAQAKTPKERSLVIFYFHRVMFHIYNKRAEEVGDKAVQLAYAIAYPSKNRDVKEMPKNINISQERFETIRKALDSYAEIQAQLMPYREASTKPGYGIPLKSDIVMGEKYIALKDQESKNTQDVIDSLQGLIGPESVLLGQIGLFFDELRTLKKSAEFEVLSAQ